VARTFGAVGDHQDPRNQENSGRESIEDLKSDEPVGFYVNAKSAARDGSSAKANSRIGFRPWRSAIFAT
jgi:hypothetical protein